MNARIFAISFAVLILVLVLELIRRQRMTFKYSLLWLSASTSVILLAYNEWILKRVAAWFGFELLSNFVFFLILGFFILLSLRLTIFVNEQNSRSETLAQSLGILEYKIDQLENNTRANNR